MNINESLEALLSDLRAVSRSNPRERLPKEEQMRSCLFAQLRNSFEVLCVERGYGSIDELSRTECDLWGRTRSGDETWLELKRCWSAKGWQNKPSEQLGTWRADVAKLAELPLNSDRYFVLVGFMDADPSDPASDLPAGVLRNINSLHPDRRVAFVHSLFAWRGEPGITHVGVWVWHWPQGVGVQ